MPWGSAGDHSLGADYPELLVTQPLKSRPLIVVLIGAALVRVVLLVVVSHHLDRATVSDTLDYQFFASHLWSDLLSPTPTELYDTLIRTPGYPLMLAALGQQTLWVLIAQIALSLLLVIVVYQMALASIGEAGALIAAVIVAFEPVQLTYDFFLLSEIPFAFGLTLGVAWWLRGLREQSWRWLACAGAVLGLATLIRPVSLYLLIVLLPITALMMRRHAPLLACLVLTVAFALPVGTWVARNLVVTGHPVFSTIQDYNMAYYRGAYAIAAEDHVTVEQAIQVLRSSITAPDSDPVTQADQLGKAGFAALLSHPRGWAEETALGAKALLVGSGASDWRLLFDFYSRIISAFGSFISVGLFVLAVSGVILAVRPRRWEVLAAASVVIYVVGVTSAGGTSARMRVPIEPLIALLAAYAVVTLRRSWVAHRAQTSSVTVPNTS
jgi:4-amino-4-deoxy-L-arabinose transferase-like glycosyltransferase